MGDYLLIAKKTSTSNINIGICELIFLILLIKFLSFYNKDNITRCLNTPEFKQDETFNIDDDLITFTIDDRIITAYVGRTPTFHDKSTTVVDDPTTTAVEDRNTTTFDYQTTTVKSTTSTTVEDDITTTFLKDNDSESGTINFTSEMTVINENKTVTEPFLNVTEFPNDSSICKTQNKSQIIVIEKCFVSRRLRNS